RRLGRLRRAAALGYPEAPQAGMVVFLAEGTAALARGCPLPELRPQRQGRSPHHGVSREPPAAHWTAEMRMRAATSLLLIFAFPCHRRGPAPPGAKTSAEVAAPGYELRLGKVVFVDYCQTCHGETGAGDGFNSFNLDPRPRDLSDPAFQKKKSDQDLEDAIR